jgi:hypothetical protein
VGSPLGVTAFFKRLGAEAREKYNDARSREISAFNNLQSQRNATIKNQIGSAHDLAHYADDLAMQQLMKEISYQLAIRQSQLSIATVTAQHIALQKSFEAGWFTPAIYEEVKRLEVVSKLETDKRQRETDQDIEKDKALKANARADEILRAETEIEISTRASLALREQEKALRAELREAYERQDVILTGVNPNTGKNMTEFLKANFLREVEHDIQGLERKIERFTEDNPKVDFEEGA